MERTVPYRYGAPVEPPWFCDREDEIGTLTARMRDGIHVFLLSPRRYGKTSVLLRALSRFAEDGGHAGYANLLLCTNEIEVATSVLEAATRAVLSAPGRARHGLEDLLRQLRVRPQVTVGADGSVGFGFEPSVGTRSWRAVLEDALAVLERASGRRRAALVLDEFQVVASVGRGLGGAFKALADSARRTGIVFSGSHLSVMEKLTRGVGAPLQGMGERVVLDVVERAPMVAYLQRRARAAGKQLAAGTAGRIYTLADAVPNHVQQLAYAAWESAGERQAVTDDDVDAGLHAVALRQGGDFAERFERLAPSQQRLLKALAASPTERVYARAFLDAVGVANANAVTKALGVLAERELVVRRGGQWAVADPFLRHWVTRAGRAGPVGQR